MKQPRFETCFWCIRILLLLGLCNALGRPAFGAGTCPVGQEGRQLDFWLGNWMIHHQEGPGTATSTVSTSLDQCVVMERWQDGRGHEGMNIFGYSRGDKTWHGLFADNEGHLHIFTEGTVAAGAAEFHGTSRGEEGGTVLNRIRINRMEPNKVEQLWEQSPDNGKNWKLVFRGEYSRASSR